MMMMMMMMMMTMMLDFCGMVSRRKALNRIYSREPGGEEKTMRGILFPHCFSNVSLQTFMHLICCLHLVSTSLFFNFSATTSNYQTVIG